MFALFSTGFGGIFIAFGIAAVIGHVLLIDALLRPFSTKLAEAPQSMAGARLRAQPAR